MRDLNAALRSQPRSDDDDDDDDDDEQAKPVEALAPPEPVYNRDLLEQQRTIVISEPVTPKLTARVMSQLLWLNSKSQEDPIRVYINTPGGSADDGFAIYDIMRFIQAPVYTISVGLNASAGTVIMLGAAKKHRYALPNANIMIHQPSSGTYGRASDIEIHVEQLLKLRERINELIAAETGRTVAQIEEETDRDHWMTAEEALAYGLISKIVTSVSEL